MYLEERTPRGERELNKEGKKKRKTRDSDKKQSREEKRKRG